MKKTDDGKVYATVPSTIIALHRVALPVPDQFPGPLTQQDNCPFLFGDLR